MHFNLLSNLFFFAHSDSLELSLLGLGVPLVPDMQEWFSMPSF